MAEQKQQQRISGDKLRAFIAASFEAVAIPRDDAKAIAQLMAQADINGSEGHGIFRLPQYIRRIKGGAVNPKANVTVEKTGPATAMVDGDNGMGHLVMQQATELAKTLTTKVTHLVQRAGKAPVHQVGEHREGHHARGRRHRRRHAGAVGQAQHVQVPGMHVAGQRPRRRDARRILSARRQVIAPLRTPDLLDVRGQARQGGQENLEADRSDGEQDGQQGDVHGRRRRLGEGRGSPERKTQLHPEKVVTAAAGTKAGSDRQPLTTSPAGEKWMTCSGRR